MGFFDDGDLGGGLFSRFLSAEAQMLERMSWTAMLIALSDTRRHIDHTPDRIGSLTDATDRRRTDHFTSGKGGGADGQGGISTTPHPSPQTRIHAAWGMMHHHLRSTLV